MYQDLKKRGEVAYAGEEENICLNEFPNENTTNVLKERTDEEEQGFIILFHKICTNML